MHDLQLRAASEERFKGSAQAFCAGQSHSTAMADRTSPAARNIYYNFSSDRQSKLVRSTAQRFSSLCSACSLELEHSHLTRPGSAPAQYVPEFSATASVSPYDHRSFLVTRVTRLVRQPAHSHARRATRAKQKR